ncbi:hypothetical protein A2699_01895 [Candidatus Gottesmanbacteria bacterium RIFCSPHIGHO2_01_FULL_43_15]|nr:MAG: hypothetical protein A2699_01895 [Candidatus Gottesmanbacteria bacterium RIFCSPHIGHO2_01_FULL_43_15]
MYERVYQFALLVVKFSRKLPKTAEADILRKQMIRSATSIAANMQEADGSRTRSEFRHAVTVSKKEAKETKLWLRMINDLYPQLVMESDPLISENEELIKILATIIIRTKS